MTSYPARWRTWRSAPPAPRSSASTSRIVASASNGAPNRSITAARAPEGKGSSPSGSTRRSAPRERRSETAESAPDAVVISWILSKRPHPTAPARFGAIMRAMPPSFHRRGARAALVVASFAVFACQRTPPTAAAPGAPSLDVPPFLPPEAPAAAAAITSDYLREQTAKISSDEFAGRGPATPGDRAARAYLASQLTALRLEPGRGAEGWEQPVDLVGIR